MAEPLTSPQKHLALDTDWVSAAGMGFLLFICAMLACGAAIRIVHGSQLVSPVTWHTWLLLGMCILGFCGAPDRAVRLVTVVVAVGPASRILLWMSRATPATQLANAALVRMIDEALYVGGCLYALWWFKTKIRH